MNLRHIETFLLVAEELHVGRAAARLHVAQPAVSQTIAALERDLGLKLFDRSGRGIRLTPAGVTYRDEVQTVLPQLERATRAARDAEAGVRGRLTIGFTAVCTLGDLADRLVGFMSRHPDIAVRLQQMATSDQMEALLAGSIDAGFTILSGGPDPVHSHLITRDELHVFFPADHRFADLGRVPIPELLDERFLLLSRDREPCAHRSFTRMCAEHDKAAEIVMEVDHLESMLAFVAAGLGVSLAPSTASRLRLDRVVSRPLDPPVPAGISVMWSTTPSPPTAALFLAEFTGPEGKSPPGAA
ncbi:MAG: LysR substrate-binding domain-containing protein [Actinomycetota bacterium]